ncbi:MAG: hypothetical protein HPY69_01415 [Armatimonadetes bacterium]|nr:hypothetical protein [Armatimonadota bacterium]
MEPLLQPSSTEHIVYPPIARPQQTTKRQNGMYGAMVMHDSTVGSPNSESRCEVPVVDVGKRLSLLKLPVVEHLQISVLPVDIPDLMDMRILTQQPSYIKVGFNATVVKMPELV